MITVPIILDIAVDIFAAKVRMVNFLGDVK